MFRKHPESAVPTPKPLGITRTGFTKTGTINTQMRLEAAVMYALQRHPSAWDVQDTLKKAIDELLAETAELADQPGGGVGQHRRGGTSHPEHPRRPATASQKVIPPDSYLGPAQGKITVEEQRAKILYQLHKARNKAAQHDA
eukprot:gene4522-14682_t